MKCARVLINTDKNADGITTISDITGALSDVLTLPYRFTHDLLLDTSIYRFFEMSPFGCEDIKAYVFGGLFYLFVLSIR